MFFIVWLPRWNISILQSITLQYPISPSRLSFWVKFTRDDPVFIFKKNKDQQWVKEGVYDRRYTLSSFLKTIDVGDGV